MTRPLTILAFCAGLFALAHNALPPAQAWTHGVASGGGGGYTGPGDVVSGADTFWSCARAYNAAFAATQGAICRLVDTPTGATTCTLNIGTNGFANTAALTACTSGTPSLATFCASGCSVTEVYDQSGALVCGSTAACNANQGTLASMPTLTLSALGGMPCLTFASSASQRMLNPVGAFTTTIPQPITLSQVIERTANFTTSAGWFALNSSGPYYVFNSAANQVDFAFGSQLNSSTNVTDSAFHAIQMVAGNNVASASNIQTDSLTQVTGNVGTGSFASATVFYFGSDEYGHFLTGSVCELAIYPVAFTNLQETNMNSNQHSSVYGYNF